MANRAPTVDPGLFANNDISGADVLFGFRSKHVRTVSVWHDDGFHYVLLDYWTARRNSRIVLVETVALNLQRTLPKHLQHQIAKIVGKFGKPLAIKHVVIQRQVDGRSCGYFSLIYAAKLVLGLKLEEGYPLDDSGARMAQWVRELISSGEIPPLPLVTKGKKTQNIQEAVIQHVSVETIQWVEKNINFSR